MMIELQHLGHQTLSKVGGKATAIRIDDRTPVQGKPEYIIYVDPPSGVSLKGENPGVQVGDVLTTFSVDGQSAKVQVTKKGEEMAEAAQKQGADEKKGLDAIIEGMDAKTAASLRKILGAKKEEVEYPGFDDVIPEGVALVKFDEKTRVGSEPGGVIQRRNLGVLRGVGLFLDKKLEWHIVRDDDGQLVLVGWKKE